MLLFKMVFLFVIFSCIQTLYLVLYLGLQRVYRVTTIIKQASPVRLFSCPVISISVITPEGL